MGTEIYLHCSKEARLSFCCGFGYLAFLYFFIYLVYFGIFWYLATLLLPGRMDEELKLMSNTETFFFFFPLFQEQLPDLHSHFSDLNLEAHMYASQWFLTLFTAKFPLCMVFHIIDLLLCEVKKKKFWMRNPLLHSINVSSCFILSCWNPLLLNYKM